MRPGIRFVLASCGVIASIGVACVVGDSVGKEGDARTWDFGIVKIVDDVTKCEHTFRYTNNTHERDEVVQVRSSCGCTVARTDKKSIEPGESIEIHSAFDVKAGRQSSVIWLLMKNAGVQEFALAAIGVKATGLSIVEQHVLGRHDAPSTIHLVGLTLDLVPPDTPMAQVEHAHVRFNGWQLIRRGDGGRGVPTRWHGSFEITSNDVHGVQDASTVTVHLGDELAGDVTIHWQ